MHNSPEILVNTTFLSVDASAYRQIRFMNTTKKFSDNSPFKVGTDATHVQQACFQLANTIRHSVANTSTGMLKCYVLISNFAKQTMHTGTVTFLNVLKIHSLVSGAS